MIQTKKIQSGVINVYKEKGFTSHDVVAIVRKLFSNSGEYGKNLKVGHTGTLDPNAEGVLPICIGRATKIAGLLTADDKSYRAELCLGFVTDTGDITGNKLFTENQENQIYQNAISPSTLDPHVIQEAINSFIGTYEQIPPMYSAIRVEGKRLYELAREGKTIERKPRKVHIFGISIVPESDSRLWLDVDCSKGTYIRSLCVDIGEKLGIGGCMGDLIRTRSGSFYVKDAIRLDDLKRYAQDMLLSNVLIPMEVALPVPKAVLLPNAIFKSVVNGHAVPIKQVYCEQDIEEGNFFWLYDSKADELIGLYSVYKGMLKLEVLVYANH